MKEQLPLRLPVDRAATLEDYVGNLACKVASLQGHIFLSGQAGSGKTHLLQARYRKDSEAGLQAFCLANLAAHSPALLDGLDQAETVCLDDIDTVISQPSWQAPLFHLFNGLRHRGGTLLMASRQRVAEFHIPLADLNSRVKAAYLLHTETLSDADKLEVIRRKAQRRGFIMNEEVCRFILERAPRDMHYLADLIEKLDAETLRQQRKVTIPFVKSALGL